MFLKEFHYKTTVEEQPKVRKENTKAEKWMSFRAWVPGANEAQSGFQLISFQAQILVPSHQPIRTRAGACSQPWSFAFGRHAR